MFFSTRNKVGMFVIAIGMSCANAGFSQSVAAAPVSDTDYLSALSSMEADMDLVGLAGQTFAPVTVTAPQLPALNADANSVSCITLQAQAKEAGRPFEIFGDNTTLSDNEIAALSKCQMPESGMLVSYLMLE